MSSIANRHTSSSEVHLRSQSDVSLQTENQFQLQQPITQSQTDIFQLPQSQQSLSKYVLTKNTSQEVQTQPSEQTIIKNKENDFSIKKNDKFLIFDINEKEMNKIKNILTECDSIDLDTILDFVYNFGMFNQNSLDSEIKKQKIIIEEDLFQEKIKKKLIKNAFIIKILEVTDEEFKFEVSNLNNKLDKLELFKLLESLDNEMNKINDECYKINYDLTIPQRNLMKNLENNYDELIKNYDNYKILFNDLKNDHNSKKQQAKQELQIKIEDIKKQLNLSQKYTVQTKLNESKIKDNIEKIIFANKNFLEFIKKAMGQEIELGSMIFKLYDVTNDNTKNDKFYYYDNYINKYTEYSNTKAYILLNLVLSNKRYRNYRNSN